MSGALERRSADLGIPGVEIDQVGLHVTAEIEYADWERIGLHLGLIRDMTSFAIGVLLLPLGWLFRGLRRGSPPDP